MFICGGIGCAPHVSLLDKNSSHCEIDTNWVYAPHQIETRIIQPQDYRPFFIQPVRSKFKEYSHPASNPTSESINLQSESGLCSGYRIQVFAGREYNLAQKARKGIENRNAMPVFIDFEAPQYKVRFGNFLTREEADAVCRQIRSEGFPDAWVVKVQVNSPR
ncbi:MAG: SPOR domain-containing protein [Calditrichota bacterium]